MDYLVNEKLNILKKPFGIPIHLKDDPFAKSCGNMLIIFLMEK